MLKLLSAVVSRHIRNADVFGRWGGEEFIILTPHTEKGQAVSLAEKLREIVEKTTFPDTGKVTCSFGITGLIEENCAAKEILERVDNALYDAKKSGRNRICVK